MQQISKNPESDIREILDTPEKNERIIITQYIGNHLYKIKK